MTLIPRLFLLLVLLPVTGIRAQPSSLLVADMAELNAAISSVLPGDEIVMASGTWTDADIRFNTNGAVGDTITLRAQVQGAVVLNGRSSLRIGGNYLKVDGLRFEGGHLSGDHVIQFRRSSSVSAHANHSRLTNTAIIDYNPPSNATQYKWVSVYGTHNRVDHNYFAGKTHDGATVVVWLNDPPNDQPNHHRIDHNHFGPRPELGKNGGETLRIGTSSRSMQSSLTTVEYNLFEGADGEIEIISNKTGDNVFRFNTFRASSGTLTLRHGNRATVTGNFFLGNGVGGSGGIRVIGEDHVITNNYFADLEGSGSRSGISVESGVPNSPLNRYFQVRNVLIAFNTFVDVEHPIVLGTGASSERSLPPENVTFANNVIVAAEADPVVEVDAEPISITWQGNWFTGQELGIDLPPGIEWADPGLAPGSGGLWRPVAGSPLIDGAVDGYSQVAVDMDGQARSDGMQDVGADEVSLDPVLVRPLLPEDVGPAWSLGTAYERASTTVISPAAMILGSFPNPFRHSTRLRIRLDHEAEVTIRIFDILGRVVAVPSSGRLSAGEHEIPWTAPGEPAGVYVVRLEAGGRAESALLLRTR